MESSSHRSPSVSTDPKKEKEKEKQGREGRGCGEFAFYTLFSPKQTQGRAVELVVGQLGLVGVRFPEAFSLQMIGPGLQGQYACSNSNELHEAIQLCMTADRPGMHGYKQSHGALGTHAMRWRGTRLAVEPARGGLVGHATLSSFAAARQNTKPRHASRPHR